MAHVQKRCRKCAKTVGPRALTCASCGSRDTAWRARYRGPDNYERSKTFDRRADAERWLTEMQISKARGIWVDPALGKITLANWSERWIEARTPVLKAKTSFGYRSMLRSRILPTFGRWKLASIGPSDVQAWINSMQSDRLSASRVRQANIVLSMMLKAAVREGLIVRNAATDADLPRIPHREAAYLEPAQVKRIAQAMTEPYDLLVRILGTLGLRFGEAVALRRRSVDLLRRRLIVDESVAEVGKDLIFGPTKTHAARRVPLTPGLAADLTQHLERRVSSDPDGLLFPAPDGGPLRHSNFYHRQWQPALRRCNVPAGGVHVLRHSAAAALISSGASPKAVEAILGHRSAAFTLTAYGHLFDEDLDEVAVRLEDSIISRSKSTADILELASPRL
jgi:integrase